MPRSMPRTARRPASSAARAGGAITRSVVIPASLDSAMLRSVARADGAAKQEDPNGRMTISSWIVEAVRRRLRQERPRRGAAKPGRGRARR